MKKFILHLILFCGLFLFTNAKSEKDKSLTRTATGRIVDASGEPVAGAKILIKETGHYTFSDFEGNYTIRVSADKEYIIQINSQGFIPIEINSSTLTFRSEHILKLI